MTFVNANFRFLCSLLKKKFFAQYIFFMKQCFCFMSVRFLAKNISSYASDIYIKISGAGLRYENETKKMRRVTIVTRYIVNLFYSVNFQSQTAVPPGFKWLT